MVRKAKPGAKPAEKANGSASVMVSAEVKAACQSLGFEPAMLGLYDCGDTVQITCGEMTLSVVLLPTVALGLAAWLTTYAAKRGVG